MQDSRKFSNNEDPAASSAVQGSAYFASEWTRAQPAVYTYLLAILQHASDVDDVMQEVAIEACKGIERFDRSRPFLPWVLAIARFRAIDFQRKRGRDRVLFNSEALKAIEEASIRSQPFESRRAAALKLCLKRLTGRYAQAIRLRYGQEMGNASVAERLRITPNAAAALLKRARMRLHDCIEMRLEAEADHDR